MRGWWREAKEAGSRGGAEKSEIGVCYLSWNKRLLGDVITKVVGGGTPPRENKKYYGGTIPWMTVKDLKGISPLDTEEHITEDAIKNCSTNLIPANTPIVATRISLGRVVKVPYATTINQDLKAIFLNESINPDFFLRWWTFKAEEIASLGSGTTVKGIRLETLRDLEFTYPVLQTQSLIVSKIDSLFADIDAGLAELARAKKNLELYRQSILNAAIRGKLVPQDPSDEPASKLLKKIGEEKARLVKEGKLKKEKEIKAIEPDGVPFEVPKGWEWVRLGEIWTELLSGYAFKSSEYVPKSRNQLIRLGNVKNDNFLFNDKEVFLPNSVANKSQQFRIKEGDLLVTMTGTRGRKDYIFTCIASLSSAERDFYLNQRVGAIRFSPSLHVSYFNLILKSSSILDPIFFTATGSVNQANIGVDSLRLALVPLPPLPEQKRIAAAVASSLSAADALAKELSAREAEANALRQSILKAAFEGRLV